MSERPQKIASVAVVNSKGEVLLNRRRDSGRFTLPGGHMEEGEAPEAGAARELREEAGVDARPDQLEHLGSDTITSELGNEIEVHGFKFQTDAVTDTSGDPDEECEGPWQWFAPEEGGQLPAEVLSELHAPRNPVLQRLGMQPATDQEALERSEPKAWCFACDKALGKAKHIVDTRDDQTVYVGSDCHAKVRAAGEAGYQPPKGGPRLYPMGKRMEKAISPKLASKIRDWASSAWAGNRSEIHDEMMKPEHAADRKVMTELLRRDTRSRVIDGERHFLLHRGTHSTEAYDKAREGKPELRQGNFTESHKGVKYHEPVSMTPQHNLARSEAEQRWWDHKAAHRPGKQVIHSVWVPESAISLALHHAGHVTPKRGHLHADIGFERGSMASGTEKEVFIAPGHYPKADVDHIGRPKPLKKMVYGGTGVHRPGDLHGWISPKGEYHHMPSSQDHMEWIENKRGDSSHHHDVNAYREGWVSVGHGGAHNVVAHKDMWGQPDHPAMATARRLAGERVLAERLETHSVDDDGRSKMKHISTTDWSNKGRVVDMDSPQQMFRSEGLDKGAMQRVAPYRPPTAEEKRTGGARDVHEWQGTIGEGEAGIPKKEELQGIREKIPRMSGNERIRALHKLAASTRVRRAADGGREFLLHRGMGSTEVSNSSRESGGRIDHDARTSWTPSHSIAHREFGAAGNPQKHTLSAWVHERHIVHVPKQIGGRGSGRNVFANEHEVVVGRGHNSERVDVAREAPDLHQDINRRARRLSDTERIWTPGEGELGDPDVRLRTAQDELRQKLGRLRGTTRKSESPRPGNWVPNTDEHIGQEYEWEYKNHTRRRLGDVFPTLGHFRDAVRNAEIKEVTPEFDRKIGNRSRTRSIGDLKSLTSGYRFPRDVNRIVTGLKNSHPLPHPIVLRHKDGHHEVMSGNTRMDAAFIHGINPTVAIVDVPDRPAGALKSEDSGIPEGTRGECYRNTTRLATANDAPGMLVVHGHARNMHGETIHHAWVEHEGQVIDPTAGVKMDKDKYYAIAHAEPHAKYTPEQAMVNMARNGHHGPWTAQEASKGSVWRKEDLGKAEIHPQLDHIEPPHEGIAAAEEAWQGGLASFGDPEAASLVQQMPKYSDYISDVRGALTKQYGGKPIKMYRSMHPDQLAAWRNGEDMGHTGWTTKRSLAQNWHKLAGHKSDVPHVLVSTHVDPEHVVMRGNPEENELVVDSNRIEGRSLQEEPSGLPAAKSEGLSKTLTPKSFWGWIDPSGKHYPVTLNSGGEHHDFSRDEIVNHPDDYGTEYDPETADYNDILRSFDWVSVGHGGHSAVTGPGHILKNPSHPANRTLAAKVKRLPPGITSLDVGHSDTGEFHQVPRHMAERGLFIKPSLTQQFKSEGLDKGAKEWLAGTLAAASILMPGSIHAPKEKAPQAQQAPTPKKPAYPKFGTHPADRFLRGISSVESSSGANTSHTPVRRGLHAGYTAQGEYALMPLTVKTVARGAKGYPEVQALADRSPREIEAAIGSDPGLALQAARAHADYLGRKFKNDEARMAHAWRHGEHASVTPEQAAQDPYVQEFQGQMRKFELGKGVSQRLAPKFDPGTLDSQDMVTMGQWQSHGGRYELRDDIPPMEGPARFRALHKLSAHTKVRRAADGKREFLLHRGVDPDMEYQAVVDPEKGEVEHQTVSSWTPHHSVAHGFARDYAANAPKKPDGTKHKPAILSAWVHEDSIHNIPRQWGALPDQEKVDQWYQGHPENEWENAPKPRGPNTPLFSNKPDQEHEVIVAPHTSKMAHPSEVYRATGLGAEDDIDAVISERAKGATYASPRMRMKHGAMKRRLGNLAAVKKAESADIELEHYSDHPGLDEIHPRYHGTGVSGNERKRKGFPGWVDRSYHYVAGSKPEADLGSKPHKYTSSVPASSIYDLATDPEGHRANAVDAQGFPSVNVVEQRIKAAGHLGFRDTSVDPNTVALFHPVRPHKHEPNTGAAGLGKSNYGPKGMGLYEPHANMRRKQGNVADTEVGIQGIKVKSGANASGGQGKPELERKARAERAKNRKQPVRSFTPEEIGQFQEELRLRDAAKPVGVVRPFKMRELDPEEGYKISHIEGGRDEFGDPTIMVNAHDKNGGHVGGARFSHDTGKNGKVRLGAEGVFVNEAHRRKGLATAMYRHAEKVTGKKIIPDADQSPEGKAFWAQPGRKFGKPFIKRELDPSEGVTFTHDEEGDLGGLRQVNAWKAGKRVGKMTYDDHPEQEGHLMAGYVEVDKGHRRKGIATAMYHEAEGKAGKPFAPSYDQTPPAKKFWGTYTTSKSEDQGHGLPHKFSILTHENPKYKSNMAGSVEPLLWAHKYEKITGKFGGERETSYLVHDIDHKEAEHLGREFGQESVLHSEGGKNKLVYTNGPNAGKHHAGEGVTVHPREPEDNYSTYKGKHLTLGLDFSKLHEPSKKAELCKEMYGNVDPGMKDFHGWISPEGEFHQMSPDEEHFSHAHLHAKKHYPTEAKVAPHSSAPLLYGKGWISTGHAGYPNARGDSKFLNDPSHPATRKLASMAANLSDKHQHMAVEYHGVNDPKRDFAHRVPRHLAEAGNFKRPSETQMFRSEGVWNDSLPRPRTRARTALRQMLAHIDAAEESPQSAVVEQVFPTLGADSFFEAARFMSGAPVREPEAVERGALYETDGDAVQAAMYLYGIPDSKENREALEAFRSVVRDMAGRAPRLGKAEVGFRPLTPRGKELAEAACRGVEARAVRGLESPGKTTAEAMVITDPETDLCVLAKPEPSQAPAPHGVGPGVPCSAREEGFRALAEVLGLHKFVPPTAAAQANGSLWTLVAMLPPEYRPLTRWKAHAPGAERAILNAYREEGTLHMWAVLDWVAGNADRHAGNIMANADGDVQLIDHGSSMSDELFDPAGDPSVFIPFYLRAWGSGKRMEHERALSLMPSVTPEVARALGSWILSIDAGSVHAAVAGTCGFEAARACLDRLAALQGAVAGTNLKADEVVNGLWRPSRTA